MDYVNPVKFFFLDASVIVKFVIDEPRSKEARELAGQGTLRTAQVCLDEAYGMIKRKWKQKKIDHEKYLNAKNSLRSFTINNRFHSLEIRRENIDDFREAKEIAAKYPNKISLSDALQIVSMKKGCHSFLGGESQPVLVTADKELAKVAKVLGLKVKII